MYPFGRFIFPDSRWVLLFKAIFSFLGGTAWLFVRVILIICLVLGGIYSLASVFFFRFLWEGLIRLVIGLACAGLVYFILRASREKEDEPLDTREL